MSNFDETTVRNIGKVLNDKDRPLKERFRALFTLKNIGGRVALDCINECFTDDSALLKHELAYCMGQMQDRDAIPILTKVLEDETQEPMVRHEAAEALGAIGKLDVKPILAKFLNDATVEVAETCEIALGRLKWLETPTEDTKLLSQNPYSSVDPAPPTRTENVPELKRILLDGKESLFERYRAMFTLRNLGSDGSINALGEGLKGSSALFRHEVAFVLGQMQDPRSIPYLIMSLEDKDENEMVRHESAEALGAIATNECMDVLKKYLTDDKRVVRESCEVALDMCEYENSPEFQYANTLLKVES